MFQGHESQCVLLAVNAAVFNFSAHKVQFSLEQQNYQQETLSLVVNTAEWQICEHGLGMLMFSEALTAY